MNQRPKCDNSNYKVLGENVGVSLHDLILRKSFLNGAKRASNNNKNINKLDFIKIKTFCASKDTMKKKFKLKNRMEKIFTNLFGGKGVVSILFKELLQPNNKKTNSSIF